MNVRVRLKECSLFVFGVLLNAVGSCCGQGWICSTFRLLHSWGLAIGVMEYPCSVVWLYIPTQLTLYYCP